MEATTQNRAIKKVAVLGSGVMGSGIALHLANIGVEVLLLDIVPFDLKEEDKANPKMRNKIVNDAFAFALKSKPAQAYSPASAARVTLGNFEDDMPKIKDCDWIIEVVIERLDIKKQVFEKVDKLRKPGTLVTSNTSGIPIHLMAEGRSEDFQKNFCGTHFFNPPRYLRLLEIIPTPKTDQRVVDFLMHYGDVFLGKETVLCKDTPAFIANRVGVYAMAKVFQLTQELGLTIEEVDALTGPAIGRPKTGTFKLSDLVGNDTGTKVMMGIKENCPNDEQAGAFEVPAYVQFLLDNKFFGNKSKKGYYYKDEKRNSFSLRLDTLQYEPTGKPKFASLEAAKKAEKLGDKVNAFIKADDKGAQLVKRSLAGLFAYVSNRV
ncbi:MAG: 3-hydroxyacyl-CoA dehydrogenase family protein, partial [Chitinophagales bacterium]|nr:3-hydroxyacyl-CoA dehydrogenase family protein [Chitinophagales bacterium]